ncbi:hypothetical protein COCSADRAFT_330260 [Bipolaris sorokiniana ND90Pr]|uniref:Uncharacterized protein n=1 Tax=Cochliobolus sativus (strain ND90Pr / ATCC 201652) TaxID=665912 RepID=M2SMY5_COCSN|nr:uncharacterized protein COCSADRAFT_330260 [Bipolaris sorokiniana ND90Pr]EMD63660.1 hypothetical protein COCSADRAFT_330260 [Bipolaris sorokiniana ND90Pr]
MDDDATGDPARPATRGPAVRVLSEGASWRCRKRCIRRAAGGWGFGGGGGGGAGVGGLDGWVDGWMDEAVERGMRWMHCAREFSRPA